jgi:hypothetical protein
MLPIVTSGRHRTSKGMRHGHRTGPTSHTKATLSASIQSVRNHSQGSMAIGFMSKAKTGEYKKASCCPGAAW